MTSPRWVLIECGSTQEFIFQSNRQRFHVGASALVTDFPTWVDKATKDSPDIEVVAAVSGSAALLVPDRDVGREVVRVVSEQALREAPGLDVWGYVETDDVATLDDRPMLRLPEARRAFERARASRPSSKARFPMMPFLDQCSMTGLPATGSRHAPGDAGRTIPISASADAALRRAAQAHQDWKKSLGTAVVTDLDRDLSPEGWTAVIHADGNGIGSIIDCLETPEEYTTFSRALELATRKALETAVQAVGKRNWLLPILLGGDDVTVYCLASEAVTFTRAYLRAFEELTTNIVPDVIHLTATAGIAFVKPHYPFSEAHTLTHQLTRAAKHGLKELAADDRSAWDFHVLHDALSRPLDELRKEHAHATVTPLLLTATSQAAQQTRRQAAHDDAPIVDAVQDLISDEPPISNKAQHSLRDALLRPPSSREAVLSRVKQRIIAVSGESAERFIETHLDDRIATGPSSLLTVMDLADVATGTSRTGN